jgi:hypothetical protein
MTKNVPTQRCGRLGSALTSLCALLSPMRALSASALVAAAMLVLGGQSAHAQDAPGTASDAMLDPGAQSAPAQEVPDAASESLNRSASVATAATSALGPWEWIFPVYDPNPSGGPSGRYTFAFFIYLGAGGVSEMIYQIDHVYYPDWLHMRHDRSTWNWNVNARWSVVGSELVFSGSGWRTDISNWNPAGYHRYPIGGTYRFPFRWLPGPKLLLTTPASWGLDRIPHWGSRTIVLSRP